MLFRELTETETKEFQQWARENYKPFSPIDGIWHPVVQKECAKINEEEAQTEQNWLERE
jgi:hypothetical protein